MAVKLRRNPKVSLDIEIKRSWFRTAMISLAVESCGQKRLRMAGSEKITPLWNLSEQRKMLSRPCCKIGHQLICNPGISRREMLQLWHQKCPTNTFGKSFVRRLDFNYSSANKVFWQTICRLPGKV